jgi:hypothetical protein
MSLKGMVRISRFVSKANAEDVGLVVGDVVTYQRTGPAVRATIKSDLRTDGLGRYGYEALFADDGAMWFADERYIIAWDGQGAAGTIGAQSNPEPSDASATSGDRA